jgi:hypothetical protein
VASGTSEDSLCVVKTAAELPPDGIQIIAVLDRVCRMLTKRFPQFTDGLGASFVSCVNGGRSFCNGFGGIDSGLRHGRPR